MIFEVSIVDQPLPMLRFHGLAARYNEGCRCEACRAANAARQRRYRSGVRLGRGSRGSSPLSQTFTQIVRRVTGDPDAAAEILSEMKTAGLTLRHREAAARRGDET